MPLSKNTKKLKTTIYISEEDEKLLDEVFIKLILQPFFTQTKFEIP
jgi:hypothetical protein